MSHSGDKIIAAGAVVATTGSLPVIRAERGQMVQLFQNLIGKCAEIPQRSATDDPYRREGGIGSLALLR